MILSKKPDITAEEKETQLFNSTGSIFSFFLPQFEKHFVRVVPRKVTMASSGKLAFALVNFVGRSVQVFQRLSVHNTSLFTCGAASGFRCQWHRLGLAVN